jgi:hypothetical protein
VKKACAEEMALQCAGTRWRWHCGEEQGGTGSAVGSEKNGVRAQEPTAYGKRRNSVDGKIIRKTMAFKDRRLNLKPTQN